MKIRVILPSHLRELARTISEVSVEVEDPVTWGSVLDAIEERYPPLAGTIREHGTGRRRAFVRFFACSEDISHSPPDLPLPAEVRNGNEPFVILGAIAGG